MFILTSVCEKDLSTCCSDYALAMYLGIIKNALNIIHIVVPIILIIMGVIQFIKLTADPDDKGGKLKKSLKNKIIATVIVFFIPYVVNLVISLASYANLDVFNISDCWKNAEEASEVLKNNS